MNISLNITNHSFNEVFIKEAVDLNIKLEIKDKEKSTLLDIQAIMPTNENTVFYISNQAVFSNT